MLHNSEARKLPSEGSSGTWRSHPPGVTGRFSCLLLLGNEGIRRWCCCYRGCVGIWRQVVGHMLFENCGLFIANTPKMSGSVEQWSPPKTPASLKLGTVGLAFAYRSRSLATAHKDSERCDVPELGSSPATQRCRSEKHVGFTD